MAIQLPSYNNQTVTRSPEMPRVSLDTSAVSQMSEPNKAAEFAQSTLMKYKELKDDGLATEKINDWDRKIQAYNIELSKLQGSDATGLVDKVKAQSAKIIGEYKFNNDEERSIFMEQTKEAQNNYELQMLKHEATEAVQFNNQQQEAAMGNALNKTLTAVYNNDQGTVDTGIADFSRAFARANKGAPKDWIAEQITNKISSGLSNSLILMGRSNPAGALTAAKRLRYMDGDNGRISEVQYRAIMESTRDEYMAQMSQQAVNNLFDDPTVKYKTVGEITGNPDDKNVSTVARPLDEMLLKARENLSAQKFTNDPYYGNIEKDMSPKIYSQFEATKNRYVETQKASVDLVIDKVTNSINKVKLNNGSASDVDRATIDNGIEALKGIGEYDKARKLYDMNNENIVTDYKAYQDADIGITTGQINSVGQLTYYHDKLSTADFNTLKAKVLSSTDQQFKADQTVADAIVKNIIDPKGKKMKSDPIVTQTKMGLAKQKFDELYSSAKRQNLSLETEDIARMATTATWAATQESPDGGFIDKMYPAVKSLVQRYSGSWGFIGGQEADNIKNNLIDAHNAVWNRTKQTPTEEEVVEEYNKRFTTTPAIITDPKKKSSFTQGYGSDYYFASDILLGEELEGGE